MRDYRKYEVWRKSHRFACEIYTVTKAFPKDEMYGIISQLRRAALSIPTNLVEGTGRNSEKEFAYFINIGSGSAAEVEYLLEFSKEMKYISEDKHQEMTLEIITIRKMLNSLYQKVKK